MTDRRKGKRRRIERREAQIGVNVRHDDGPLILKMPPKRIRHGHLK